MKSSSKKSLHVMDSTQNFDNTPDFSTLVAAGRSVDFDDFIGRLAKLRKRPHCDPALIVVNMPESWLVVRDEQKEDFRARGFRFEPKPLLELAASKNKSFGKPGNSSYGSNHRIKAVIYNKDFGWCMKSKNPVADNAGDDALIDIEFVDVNDFPIEKSAVAVCGKKYALKNGETKILLRELREIALANW